MALSIVVRFNSDVVCELELEVVRSLSTAVDEGLTVLVVSVWDVVLDGCGVESKVVKSVITVAVTKFVVVISVVDVSVLVVIQGELNFNWSLQFF